ncbi:MAG TPA: bL9 family ribosomal protein, partial [Leptospiraceae bacterium]|nr:bL9 family ribosomal protein [Leptospiraceae bacterium]
MKVILQKDVPGLGDAGEVKNVADGYARNYLLPRKLGTAARGDSTKVLEHQKRMMQRKIDKRNKEMAD